MYRSTFLVKYNKIIYYISGGDIGNKILIQTQGNSALVLVTQAERFSIFNPALFHAVASSLYTVMSEFDLIWKKKLMKSKASRHYNTAVGLIQKRSPGYKMAVSRLDRMEIMMKELQDRGTDTMALTLLVWSIVILGGLYLLTL